MSSCVLREALDKRRQRLARLRVDVVEIDPALGDFPELGLRDSAEAPLRCATSPHRVRRANRARTTLHPSSLPLP